MEKQRTKPKQKTWSEVTKLDPTGPSSLKGSGRSSNDDESPRPEELNVWSQGTRHLVLTPSPKVQHPRLKYMANSEEEGVIREALAACRDHNYTRFNLERHVLSGEDIPIQRLKRGDVVFLCTTHELYGPARRRYIYWGTAKSGREKYLVFFTLVTNGGKDVIQGSHNWFLEPTKYRFVAEPYHERNAYVSWTRVVAISPPRRDSIFECNEVGKKVLQKQVTVPFKEKSRPPESACRLPQGRGSTFRPPDSFGWRGESRSVLESEAPIFSVRSRGKSL